MFQGSLLTQRARSVPRFVASAFAVLLVLAGGLFAALPGDNTAWLFLCFLGVLVGVRNAQTEIIRHIIASADSVLEATDEPGGNLTQG